LLDGLDEHDLSATVELEASGLPGRYRLYVVSDDFTNLLESERQDIVWRVLKERWSREDQVRITLSLMLTEREAHGS